MNTTNKFDRSFLQLYQVGQIAKQQLIPHEYEDGTPLPSNFVPSPFDVICGRGKTCYEHEGNKRFRVTVARYLEKYIKSTSKLEKSLVVMSIVDHIRDESPNAGFVKKDCRTGGWRVVGDHHAREKVGHALRDAIKAAHDVKRNGNTMPSKASIEKKQRALLKMQQEIFRQLLQKEDLGINAPFNSAA